MSNAAAPATEGSDHADAPLHVAIIMDGNGRWAAARGLPRAEGHRRGVEALRRVVRAAHELGIQYLTIFSFSSENWSRPATEIGDLFGLLRRFIRNDLASLHRDGVRVRVIGERAGLVAQLANLDPYPESVPINELVRVEGTPLADEAPLDPLEFVRTIAVARITMPLARVRLSAGRQQMSEAVQALCFLAGANSVFYGEKLLTTGNPDVEKDKALFEKLGVTTAASQHIG